MIDQLSEQATKPIKVFLAQSAEINLFGIEAIVQGEELLVVSSSTGSNECIKNIKTEAPDVIVLSMDFHNGIKGVDVAGVIKQQSPNTKIIFLTDDETDDHVFAAFAAGAHGYFLRSATVDQIKAGLRAVLQGTYALCPRIAERILNTTLQAGMTNLQNRSKIAPFGLTTQELDVLRVLVDGSSKVKMSKDLSLSEGTIKAHMQRIMEKLKVSDRTQAAIKAIRAGMLSLDKRGICASAQYRRTIYIT